MAYNVYAVTKACNGVRDNPGVNHFNDTRPIQQDAILAVGGKGVNLLRYIPHQQVYVWRVRENAIV